MLLIYCSAIYCNVTTYEAFQILNDTKKSLLRTPKIVSKITAVLNFISRGQIELVPNIYSHIGNVNIRENHGIKK